MSKVMSRRVGIPTDVVIVTRMMRTERSMELRTVIIRPRTEIKPMGAVMKATGWVLERQSLIYICSSLVYARNNLSIINVKLLSAKDI